MRVLAVANLCLSYRRPLCGLLSICRSEDRIKYIAGFLSWQFRFYPLLGEDNKFPSWRKSCRRRYYGRNWASSWPLKLYSYLVRTKAFSGLHVQVTSVCICYWYWFHLHSRDFYSHVQGSAFCSCKWRLFDTCMWRLFPPISGCSGILRAPVNAVSLHVQWTEGWDYEWSRL